MAEVRPFRALRPPPELADGVAAPPYDVMDGEEARAMAVGRPDSFLHVSRPEIDLAIGTDPYADEVHQRGRSALEDMVLRGVLVRDAVPTYSVYRQQMGDVTQTGVVVCASVDDYASGVIRTHEHTRPDKETDRVRHIDALDAHDEPVFYLSPRSAAVEGLIAEVTACPPEYDLVSDDGVGHTLWVVADPGRVERLTAAFAAIPRLYVADGHHRSAAAVRVRELRHKRADRDPGEVDAFLVVVFAQDQVNVLPYHRAVSDLAGLSPGGLLAGLAADFDLEEAETAVQPQARGRFGMYLAGRWYRLSLRDPLPKEAGDVARLDVSVLQDRALGPLLGVGDPRTDDRIRFVGGIRGTAELERLVDRGACAVAFSLYPTSVADLMRIADRDEVMPPKSTWFEPKLRSGLVVHAMH
jgi:uncharacterized protein (DUF1015 family)